ncbi:unnamed protein product [Closterium sp. Naga37s-1]|nr:unnamed protein product [Closterium sp. Naga37s-1]
MEVARISMIHANAPHFLWSFAVRYAAHQLNLWPRVSLPETSPILRWTGKVGDASVFRVWGSRAFVRDTSADKLSARAIPCVFPGFPPDAPSWQFYHPTSRRVLPSQDVTFDESVPFYYLFPYRSAPLPPPPLFLVPGPPPVDPLSPQGRAPSGVSQVDPLPGIVPVEVDVDSGAARGAASGGAASGVLSLSVRSLGVLSLRVLSLRVRGLGVLSLGVRSLGVLSLGVLCLLEVLRMPCRGGSLSLHRTCASGLLGAPAFGVALLEPGGLPLEALELLELEVLQELELEAMELELLELLEPLVPEVLVLEVLELLELEKLKELELGALELELLELLEPLVLEVLVLEVLEVQELEVLQELELETPELEALALGVLVPLVLVLETLDGRDRTSCSRRYSQPPHCLLLLLTLSRLEVLQSVVSLCLVLPRLFALFALVVVFRDRVLLLSPARTIWHFVLPLFHSVSPYRLLLRPLWMTDRTLSLT